MILSDIYTEYYSKLLRFAQTYLNSEADAENLVQDVFLKLWDKHPDLRDVENINAYLFKLVKNACINHLQHEKNVREYMSRAKYIYETDINIRIQALERFDDVIFDDKKIEEILNNAIEKLPERCREIFKLSRFEGLKYTEIANRLSISPNTVENQMVIALKKLRITLKDYLPSLIAMIVKLLN